MTRRSQLDSEVRDRLLHFATYRDELAAFIDRLTDVVFHVIHSFSPGTTPHEIILAISDDEFVYVNQYQNLGGAFTFVYGRLTEIDEKLPHVAKKQLFDLSSSARERLLLARVFGHRDAP